MSLSIYCITLSSILKLISYSKLGLFFFLLIDSGLYLIIFWSCYFSRVTDSAGFCKLSRIFSCLLVIINVKVDGLIGARCWFCLLVGLRTGL